jgi:hypothetical protein
MNHHFNSPYLTIHETSDYVRLAKRTLDNMRYMGTGPMFQKHDGKTFHKSMNSKSGHRKAALTDVKVLIQSVAVALQRPYSCKIILDDPSFPPFPAFPNRVSRRFVII